MIVFKILSTLYSIRFRIKLRAHGVFSFGNARNIKFGIGCTVNSGVYIQGRNSVEIGDNVVLSRGVSIFDAGLNTKKDTNNSTHVSSPVVIGANTWVGANAIILPGVVIGSNCVIGAGAVVSKNVEDKSLVFGNPMVVKRLKE